MSYSMTWTQLFVTNHDTASLLEVCFMVSACHVHINHNLCCLLDDDTTKNVESLPKDLRNPYRVETLHASPTDSLQHSPPLDPVHPVGGPIILGV